MNYVSLKLEHDEDLKHRQLSLFTLRSLIEVRHPVGGVGWELAFLPCRRGEREMSEGRKEGRVGFIIVARRGNLISDDDDGLNIPRRAT